MVINFMQPVSRIFVSGVDFSSYYR